MYDEPQTLADLKDQPEDVPEAIESSDYSPYDLMPIGYYYSASRTITPKTSRKGNRYFEVSFDSGLEDVESGKVFGMGKFPERMFLFGTLFPRTNRPGQTSDIADYLRSCGINPKEITSVADALEQSQQMPVNVFVSWTNKTSKDPVTGEWEKEVLKGKDFNQGTPDAPNYVPTAEKDGVTYTARHKPVGFKKI
jgi:hypothetical protein